MSNKDEKMKILSLVDIGKNDISISTNPTFHFPVIGNKKQKG
jgi:hypothetical protein